jgi:hypothetical protein
MRAAHCVVRKQPISRLARRALDNGMVRLVAVPAIGGRIMAYDLGRTLLVCRSGISPESCSAPQKIKGDGSLAAWKNYGGDKTWPRRRAGTTTSSGTARPIRSGHGRYTLDALWEDGAGPGPDGKPARRAHRRADHPHAYHPARIQPRHCLTSL